MHSDKYCGETVGTILKGLLWEYLPERAIQLFQKALTAEVGNEPPEEPIPAEHIWEKLEDEIICHSCFQDYIAVVEAHPPNNVEASMADFSSLLGNGFAPAAGAVDPVINGCSCRPGQVGRVELIAWAGGCGDVGNYFSIRIPFCESM
jgi:hypothetical protein